MAIQCYELSARGDSLNGYVFRMRSREIYMDRNQAEEAIAAFVEKCCDQSMLECADRATLKVLVVERTLVMANDKQTDAER